MIKNKSVAFVLFVVLCILLWNILELIYASFITKSGYHFDPAKSIGTPAAVSIMVGYLLFLRKKDGE
jgi:hypothetical protein